MPNDEHFAGSDEVDGGCFEIDIDDFMHDESMKKCAWYTIAGTELWQLRTAQF